MARLDADWAGCYHTVFLHDRIQQGDENHILENSPNIRILIADDVSDSGLQPLRNAGFSVERGIDFAADELAEALRNSEGLVVRSETKVTADLMDKAPR